MNRGLKLLGITFLVGLLGVTTLAVAKSGSLDPRGWAKMINEGDMSKKAAKTTTPTKTAPKNTSQKSDKEVKVKADAKSISQKITEPLKTAVKTVTTSISKKLSKPASLTKPSPSTPPGNTANPGVTTVLDPDEFVDSLADGGEQAVSPYAYTPQVAGIPVDEADIYFSDTLDTSGGQPNEDLVISLGYEWQDSNSIDYHTTIALWNDPNFVTDYQNTDQVGNREDLTSMIDASLFPEAAPNTLSVTKADDGTIRLEFVIPAEDGYAYQVNFKLKDIPTDTPEEIQSALHQLINMGLITTDALTNTQPANLTLIQQITTSTTTFLGRIIDWIISLKP